MAAHNWTGVGALARGLILIAGSFAPNGSSALVASAVKGKGFTVARSDVGIYTVTFDAKYVALVSVWAHLQLAAAGDVFAQVGTYTAASRTLVITAWDISGAAAADVAANANNRMHFGAIFSNSYLTQ